MTIELQAVELNGFLCFQQGTIEPDEKKYRLAFMPDHYKILTMVLYSF